MKLPVISGDDFVKRVKKRGFVFEKQEGSHMILRLNIHPFTKLSVPKHKELAKGLLRKLLNDANLSVDEFIRLKK